MDEEGWVEPPTWSCPFLLKDGRSSGGASFAIASSDSAWVFSDKRYSRFIEWLDVPPTFPRDQHPHLSTRIHQLLVEMKVKANSTNGQATRYANWFEESYKRHRRLLIYVLPSHRMRESVEKTIGDPRWCIVTYQSLHDHVLSKVLQHHNLTEHARWVIREYIKNLRT
jgi:hypothetical protein